MAGEPDKNGMVKLQLWVTEPMREWLHSEAKRQGNTYSSVVRCAIVEKMDRDRIIKDMDAAERDSKL